MFNNSDQEVPNDVVEDPRGLRARWAEFAHDLVDSTWYGIKI